MKFKILIYHNQIVQEQHLQHHFQRKNTMKDHKNCVKEMIEFIEVKYPIYVLQVLTFITDSDVENDQFHWYGE